MPVLLLSILADYLIAARIAATGDGPSRRLGWLMVGVACNLAILGFYKYVDFIIQNINVISTPLLGVSLPLLQVVLPIGVSFIVFEKISYLIDVHRGVTPPARTIFDYSLFVLFFPKLLAGPIIKYHEMDPQIRRLAPMKADEVLAGVERFARGLVKKLLLADPLGIFVDQVFGASSELGVGRAWLGLLCFTLQIYFDFSGYSDMAIGLARMLGFRLRENFATPYIAQSMTEFWQRWHISFTTWIRDYLYIPLGGNRGSKMRTYVNLWICFLLSGIWHGAAWNFVIWGAYNGLFLTLDRVFLARLLTRINPHVANLLTLLIIMFGWAIFRASTDRIGTFFMALFGLSSEGRSTIVIGTEVWITAAIGALICILPTTTVYLWLTKLYESSTTVRSLASMGLLLLFAIACARPMASQFQPFLYFRF